MKGPDFLVIGAQKSATTWLDRNLRTHPLIWLPPEKEIHYFDLPRPLPFASLQYAPWRAVRHWASFRLKRDLQKVDRGEQSMEWYRNYYYGWRTERWYRSIFSPAGKKVAGETTPRYAVLGAWSVARIKRMLPDLKVVYLLRDPIDRMWSDMAMFQDVRFGGSGVESLGERQLLNFLSKGSNLRHSRYWHNLKRWERAVGRNRIHLCFTDDVVENPEELLAGIFNFLGVDPTHRPPAELMKSKINDGRYPAMPAGVERRLAQALLSDTRRLHDRLGTPRTAAWVDRMEGVLA